MVPGTMDSSRYWGSCVTTAACHLSVAVLATSSHYIINCLSSHIPPSPCHRMHPHHFLPYIIFTASVIPSSFSKVFSANNIAYCQPAISISHHHSPIYISIIDQINNLNIHRFFYSQMLHLHSIHIGRQVYSGAWHSEHISPGVISCMGTDWDIRGTSEESIWHCCSLVTLCVIFDHFPRREGLWLFPGPASFSSFCTWCWVSTKWVVWSVDHMTGSQVKMANCLACNTDPEQLKCLTQVTMSGPI